MARRRDPFPASRCCANSRRLGLRAAAANGRSGPACGRAALALPHRDRLSAMTANQQQGVFIEKVPDGDNRTRMVCPDCGYVEYTNPKIVVGAVCAWEDRVLLCRRAIAPSLGLWTIPAGYMETGETTAGGGARGLGGGAGACHHRRPGRPLRIQPHRPGQCHLRRRCARPSTRRGRKARRCICSAGRSDPRRDELAFPSIR